MFVVDENNPVMEFTTQVEFKHRWFIYCSNKLEYKVYGTDAGSWTDVMVAIHGTLGGNSEYNDKEIYENLSIHQSNEKLKMFIFVPVKW